MTRHLPIVCLLAIYALSISCYQVKAQSIKGLPDSVNRKLSLIKNTRERIDTLVQIGNRYCTNLGSTHHYNYAVFCYNEALRLANDYKFIDAANKPDTNDKNVVLGSIYECLGTIYNGMENRGKALEYYKLSQEYYERTILSPDTCESCYNQTRANRFLTSSYLIADVYTTLRDSANAMKYAQKMIMNNVPAGWEYYDIFNTLYCHIMRNIKNLDSFKAYFKKLPDTNFVIKERFGPVSDIYVGLKSYYYEIQGDYDKAIQIKIDWLPESYDSAYILDDLVYLLKKKERYKEAIYYQEILHTMQLRNMDVAAASNVQNELLTTDNKLKAEQNKVLALQKKRADDRNKYLSIIGFALLAGLGVSGYSIYRNISQNKVLKKQYDKINFLLRENHHRVKNNLQIISSIVDINKVKVPEDARFIMSDIQTKVQNIASIHQLLQNDKAEEYINVREYLDKIIPYTIHTLMPGKEQVSYIVDIPAGVHEEFGRLLSLSLVLNEMVINSIKHVLKVKPMVNIAITSVIEAGNRLVIKYQDDGPGLNGHMQKGTGLRIVDRLVSSMDASLRYETHATGFVAYVQL